MDSDIHAAMRRRGILIVDDSALQRQRAVDLLQARGFDTIHQAEEGQAALDLLRDLAEPPLVAIVDLHMPGMDGIELIQHLGESRVKPALVIVSSADANLVSSVETIVAELNLPLLGALSKPLDGFRLDEALARYATVPDRPSTQKPQGAAVSPQRLAAAIAAGLIVPYYQPKVSLLDGQVVGLEALARWIDPVEGMIAPDRFVAVAEQHGLMHDLTLTLYDQVLANMADWRPVDDQLGVAINISASSLSDRQLADEIIQRTEASGISPHRITLEVTESALVSDLASALATLVRLRLRGIGLAIDDYGTGFSSMQQLSRIPFTELKIDRSFVHRAHHRSHLLTILESAVDMGRRLGLKTVAEGVETVEELQLLQAIGCHQAQGFLIGRPMPVDALDHWREQHEARWAVFFRGTYR